MKNNRQTYSFLQVLLTVISTSCLLISNIITSKQMQFPFGITMTGAVFIFPVTYILSDVFSECYGYRWSRVTCYFSFAMNLVMVLAFQVAIAFPAPSYWPNQQAFETVLGNSPRILFASLAGFMAGDFVNDIIFRRMKANYPRELKGFSARAILSSFVGEIADSFVFLPLAFLGEMPVMTLLQMTVVQVLLKTGYEIVILPVTNYVVRRVDSYEMSYRRQEA